MSDPDAIFRVEKVAAPLRQSVTESIRNAIALGRFRAGDRLPERELCELTGVSRTLVREALRQLESEGLVVVEPNRGPFVARLTREQAEGVYQVRGELEGLACRLFAENAGEAQRRALADAFEELKAAVRGTDAQAPLRAKNRFYACLCEGTGNEALGNCLRLLNSRITLLRATSMRAPGRIERSIAELTELMDALISGDGPRARELGQRHVRLAGEAALGLMQADNAD